MLDDIPALEPALQHKSSLLAKVRRQQVAKNLPDYIFSGLAALGCTDAEISTLTRCPKEDLRDKAQPIAEGKARLKHALRKAQIKQALRGNSTMLVWLGKAILGQSDQPSAAPQHTNIVVTADLLSNLQRSYHSTLSDIRRSKAHNDILITPDKSEQSEILNPVNQPNYPDKSERSETLITPVNPSSSPLASYPPNLPAIARLGERGTDPESQAPSAASESECDVRTERYDPEVTQPNSLPISDEASSQIDDASCEEPAPPGVPTPAQTPTPTPKRPRSLLLEKSGKTGELTSYGVAKLAKRWSARLKRMEATRGGSRKEAQLDKGSS